MTRIPFRDILHAGFDYTENVRHLLVDRVFSIMDKQNLSQLHVEQWIKGLSTILRGTIDERINFAYNVYDLMMNGKIKKEQVFPSMRGCLINMGNMGPDEDLDETVKDMIELMFKTLDVDRDGTISKSDFKKAVMKNNLLLLECMGPVFPSRDFRNAFFMTFTNNTVDF
ncbi:hypothetical protein PV325_009978 [Microctonus aethiopoides]|nr:hypothetical protein PV325_009978 [Microctonus aethiopoides]KAK0074841.1 hypothetical protein PV326_012130 [Microctonus aethiopoides]